MASNRQTWWNWSLATVLVPPTTECFSPTFPNSIICFLYKEAHLFSIFSSFLNNWISYCHQLFKNPKGLHILVTLMPVPWCLYNISNRLFEKKFFIELIQLPFASHMVCPNELFHKTVMVVCLLFKSENFSNYYRYWEGLYLEFKILW